MKLLENIVKNMECESIPKYMTYIMQDYDGEVKYTDSYIKPCFGNGAWIRARDCKGNYLDKLPPSEDAGATLITREEIVQAYGLVEQGYALWFGGECPVKEGDVVSVIYRDGGKNNNKVINKSHLSSSGYGVIWLHKGDNEDIIGYKLVRRKPKVEEKLSLPTYYCEDKLQNTILDVWTSKSGDLCINLTPLGVNNEVVMSPITALQFANDLSALAIKIMEKEND